MSTLSTLEILQGDRTVLTKILYERQTAATETFPLGVRILWTLYVQLLVDTLTTLNSLITALTPKP